MKRSLVLSLLAVLSAVVLAGCGAQDPVVEEPVKSAHPGLKPGLHAFIAADGIEVPYAVSGAGETTVLLVHCWMCERSFWDAQVPVLQDRYRVIALDLPGHGKAGGTREPWTIEGYGQDVARLLEHLDLRQVILVGHSMGAPVSLSAAALAGERVIGVVAVDALHDAEFDFQTPEVQQALGAFEDDFRAVCSNFVSTMFVEEGVEEVVEKVRRVGCEESNADVGKALMRDFGELNFPELFRQAGVPIRAINAAAPNATRVETNRKYADFDVVLMENVGHYLHMTRPEEFNVLLLQTLEGF